MEKIILERDGLHLVGYLQKPNFEKCDIVIMMHGFLSDMHGCIFDKLAESLMYNNIASIRFDFNGHGKSGGKFKDMNIFNEINDGIKIIEYVKSQPFVDKIYLLGHSQGGVIASMLAGYYCDYIDKIILLAPAATLKDNACDGRVMGTEFNPKNIPPYVTIGHGKNAKDIGGHYFRIAQSLPIFEVASLYNKKVCLIYGEQDRLVKKSDIEKYNNIYKNCQTYYIVDENHEFEYQSSKALNIIINFLNN